jgi:hypothetical protein
LEDSAPQSVLYTIERGTGDHKHMDTDLYLKDAAGRILVGAKAQSAVALRKNFTIVDANGGPTGYIETQGALIHYTLTVQDFAHNVIGQVLIGGIHQRGTPPECSIQDANGGEMGRIVYKNRIFSFSLTRPDGSRIFDASIATGGGLRATLTAFGHKAYNIALFDPEFPQSMIVALFAAIDTYG